MGKRRKKNAPKTADGNKAQNTVPVEDVKPEEVKHLPVKDQQKWLIGGLSKYYIYCLETSLY